MCLPHMLALWSQLRHAASHAWPSWIVSSVSLKSCASWYAFAVGRSLRYDALPRLDPGAHRSRTPPERPGKTTLLRVRHESEALEARSLPVVFCRVRQLWRRTPGTARGRADDRHAASPRRPAPTRSVWT